MSINMGEGDQNDRERLAVFMKDTRDILFLFVQHQNILLPNYMRGYMEPAWPQVQIAINNTTSILRGEQLPDEFWSYTMGIFYELEELDMLLELYGLTGPQLNLKLGIFNHYYTQIVEEPSFTQLVTNQEETDAQIIEKKKKIGLMSKLLGVINSILGSLSKAIPGVDIIKEYKEMVEHGYNIAQEV